MAFVLASGMAEAEPPKQLWTSKIRGECAGKWHGKGCELVATKPSYFQRQMCPMQESMKAGNFKVKK